MTDPFIAFGRCLRSPDQNPFAALDQLCQAIIGHQLFSCSQFSFDAQGHGTAARIYTSDEENYPTSGLKEITPNRWTRHVIDNHESFVANSVDGFSDVFPDHEFIASLGLGAVINVPVIVRGEFLGTVNLLHETGYYGPHRLSLVGQIETAAQLAFLYLQHSPD